MGGAEELVWSVPTVGELKVCRGEPLKEAVDPEVWVRYRVGDFCVRILDAWVTSEAEVSVNESICCRSPLGGVVLGTEDVGPFT